MSSKTIRTRQGIGAAFAVAAIALGTAGCEATFHPPQLTVAYGLRAVPVETVPYDIAMYPHVYFDGGWFYLVNGEWYTPTRSGWVRLREEPQELGRYRRSYQQPQRYRQEAPPPLPAYPEEQGRYRRY